MKDSEKNKKTHIRIRKRPGELTNTFMHTFMHALMCVLICVSMCCQLFLLPAFAAFHAGQGSGGNYHFLSSESEKEDGQAEQKQQEEKEKSEEKKQSEESKQAEETPSGQEETKNGPSSSSGRSTVCPNPTTSADTGTGALTWTEGGKTWYQFDGKKYMIKEDWGLHYLTGFSPESTGSLRTTSGAEARANYTVASTSANLNRVILVKAEDGTGALTGRNRYDGIYKCQDTGGDTVEYGLPRTGGVPVVDLFFDTAEQAEQVSSSGWIFARIYILEEVE